VIRFAHPAYLHLLWVGLLLLAAAWLEYRWRWAAMKRWASEALWDAALPDRAPGRLLAKRILLTVGLMLGVIALAGPQVGTRLVEVTREGSDIALVVDVSASMMTEDIAPNRLLTMRHEIAELLGQLRGDRVALVPFAGVAFVQVPLTLDYSAVVSVLDALDPGIIPQPGTALAEAIGQARKAFRVESKAQKVMIIISDGEDHEAGAVTAAKEAAKEGVIIYTVGMATAAGGPIPVKDDRGHVADYKRGPDGETVISRLDEKTLKDVADAGGGEYYRASAGGDEFRRILKKISGMDKEQFESKEYTNYEDRFQWLLMGAFVLAALEEIIPRGRRRRR